MPARQVTDRLMRLDAIVLQPELRWLATEDEKVVFFSLMAPSLPRERLPHVMVDQGGGRRLRLFPDDQPIGVATTGRVVFTYLVTSYDTEALRSFIQRHADLLRVLPGWTLRLVLPQQIADGAARFEGVVRDELTPLRPELLAELKWFFGKRRSTPSLRALSFEDPRSWTRSSIACSQLAPRVPTSWPRSRPKPGNSRRHWRASSAPLELRYEQAVQLRRNLEQLSGYETTRRG